MCLFPPDVSFLRAIFKLSYLFLTAQFHTEQATLRLDASPVSHMTNLVFIFLVANQGSLKQPLKANNEKTKFSHDEHTADPAL